MPEDTWATRNGLDGGRTQSLWVDLGGVGEETEKKKKILVKKNWTVVIFPFFF